MTVGVLFWRLGRATACVLLCPAQAVPAAHPPLGADCNDDLTDCSLAERDSLRDWQGRLYSKYAIVGEVAKEGGASAATAAVAAEPVPAGPQ